jgi:hypothetical protein
MIDESFTHQKKRKISQWRRNRNRIRRKKEKECERKKDSH